MDTAPTKGLSVADCEQIAQANLLNSPLLGLPAELRNRIFRLVFSDKPIKVYPKWDDPRCYKDYTEPRGAVALLQCCHQVYGEAQGLLCSASTFDLQDCSLYGFVRDFGTVKAAFLTSIICSSAEAYDKITLKEVAPYVALERAHIIDARGYNGRWVSAMRRKLDKASGGRVSAKEVMITSGELDVTGERSKW